MNLLSGFARRSLRLALCAVILAVSSTAIAQSVASVAYTISLSSPEQHLVEVQIILPAGAAQRELQLPVWNALYQVRDFAQYVNWVHAKDRSGKSLPLREVDKSRWLIERRTGRRDCRSTRSTSIRLALRRAVKSTSRLLQSGADSDVSRGRALGPAEPCVLAIFRGMAHRHSSLKLRLATLHRRTLRQPGRLPGRDRQLCGVRFRRVRRPLPRHRRRRPRRLRHGKDRCRPAQDCRRCHQLDE